MTSPKHDNAWNPQVGNLILGSRLGRRSCCQVTVQTMETVKQELRDLVHQIERQLVFRFRVQVRAVWVLCKRHVFSETFGTKVES